MPEVSMTNGVASIDFNNAVMNRAPAVQQPAVERVSTFSETFRNASLSSGSADLDALFDLAGLRYNVPPNLLKAVAKVESGFKPDATSKAGAMGIMQLMPGTAQGLGVTDPYDPEQNIMGGAKYLRQMLDRFGGDVQLALAAYNAGAGAVEKYGGIPPYKETQNYVPMVLGYYNGGDITAGMITYSSTGAADKSGGTSSTFNFSETLSQMLFIKIIEMQMNSSSDNKDKKVF